MVTGAGRGGVRPIGAIRRDGMNRELNAFIARSRTRAQQLDTKTRTLLLISKGAKLVQPSAADLSIESGALLKMAADSPEGGPWCKAQRVNAAGHPLAGQSALWISRADLNAAGSREAWSQFPLSVQSAGGPATAWTRVIATGSVSHVAEAPGKVWYAVSVADENNTQVNGWVCDHGQPLVELKSPWDWPGFDIVSLETSVSDMFQRALFVADNGTPDELSSFEGSFNTARSDEALRKIEDAIDAQGQHDGKITAHELQLALGKTWLADRIDHLVVKYESEWGGEMSKWEALNPHMHAGLPIWQVEMNRIDRLRFWNSLESVSGWPTSASVFHFHPIGLVGSFKTDGGPITIEMLLAAEPGNTRGYYESILPFVNEYARAYSVNTPRRIAHFLSQCAHESALRVSEEGLDYSPQQMRKTFGCKGGPKNYDRNCDDCTHGRLRDKLWTQATVYAHHPESLANYVYANRMGNGDEASGDGYKYRGRGMLQVTGKDGYRAFQNQHNQRSPGDHQDFLASPDLLASNARYAVESAYVFWSRNNLNSVADTGHVTDVTQIVNGGQNGYSDRLARFNRVAPLVGIPCE